MTDCIRVSLSLFLSVTLAVGSFAAVKAADVGIVRISASQGPAGASEDPNTSFQRLADSFFDEMFKLQPNWATGAGIHDYDLQYDDMSVLGYEKRIAVLNRYLEQLNALNPTGLKPTVFHDRELLTNHIRARLLSLQEMQDWRKNPDYYPSHASSSIFNLIKRDFAPLAERMKSVIARERAIPQSLIEGRKNLNAPEVPRIYTEVAIEQLPGIKSFFRESVPEALKTVKDKTLVAQFKESNTAVLKSLEEYDRFLKDDLLAKSKGNFAIGPEFYARKLQYEEMVDEPIPSLLDKGYKELHRLQKEFQETAKSINPKADPKDTLIQMATDHPRPDHLLAEVNGCLSNIRQWCIDKSIVTMPSKDPLTVEETPPFERALTFASMDAPGPFEKKAKEAFYNVTLPEPGWSAERTEEHMRFSNRPDILVTSIHEAYPGHYTQFLWSKKLDSKVRKLIDCGTNVEGWAHYCEQMMLDEGFGNGDKKIRLAQLHEALLRVCRYIVGIQMHTKGMTYDEAVAFFVNEGYQEKANAERESKRGTSDPTYLVYTLGKLQILALREDYKKLKGASFNLKDFHDKFLSEGGPPIKVVREELLSEHVAK